MDEDQDTPMYDAESDFYGDEDVVKDLNKKVANFDVKTWWQTHETPATIPPAQGASHDISHLHNPYAGDEYAWQLTETIEAFLARVPPATTPQTPTNRWIWTCNPHIKRQPRKAAANQRVRGGEDEAPEAEGADLATLMQAGEERLHFASDFIEQCRRPGVPSDFIARESRKAGADAANDILNLARALRVTCGKWLLFRPASEVNEVWGVIAKATAGNKLGIAAKVEPMNTAVQRPGRLICVYTADFSDRADVIRVARKLKQLGLASETLYYKPDAFTYLGIASSNPWRIKASLYDTKVLLGE
ncbi:hypothetical protein F4861DRAFT_537153 [Xylaria intraflava]|nr:hypothetical protein F4861DRAFT_537153 [Xylaria intraflava]